MTEISDRKELPAAVQQFVLCWGDMGGQWGVNRSIAQIQALLYLSPKPLTAEDIADTLAIARSNVSNSIKQLQTWGLIRRVPVLGDRRDFFEAETDVWTIAAKIAAVRKEREVDPALAALQDCATAAKTDPSIDPVIVRRLDEMRSFTETMSNWYEQIMRIPRPKLLGVIRLGSKVIDYLPIRKAK
jgi:DNA-binding transcriptional regulator GbsR (MarR family)